MQSIYVDDVVFGADDEDIAFKLYQESKKIPKEGSFNLRKFTTSCSLLQRQINQAEDREASTQMSGALEETFVKATLGGA